jgi:Ni/Co efflux regulator RcnB
MMKKLVLLVASVCLIGSVTAAVAQNPYAQTRAQRKAEKKQAKAQKKYMKRQQKAQNKMFRESQKKSYYNQKPR